MEKSLVIPLISPISIWKSSILTDFFFYADMVLIFWTKKLILEWNEIKNFYSEVTE
jgi:hypothetical protein